MATRDALLAEFDHEIAATMRLLACVPADRLQWTPRERCRSMGALATHLAEITCWSLPILELPRFDLEDAPLAPAEPPTLNEMLGLFGRHAAEARARLERRDVELDAMWQLRQGGQELFSLPRAAAFRTFVLGHVVHHRGQLSVYLRLNDIPVPPIYGPAANARGVQTSSARTLT